MAVRVVAGGMGRSVAALCCFSILCAGCVSISAGEVETVGQDLYRIEVDTEPSGTYTRFAKTYELKSLAIDRAKEYCAVRMGVKEVVGIDIVAWEAVGRPGPHTSAYVGLVFRCF